MNKDNPWYAIRGIVTDTTKIEEGIKNEIHIIKKIVIPLTYNRIDALIGKILRKHC